jgi:hypothetical protein
VNIGDVINGLVARITTSLAGTAIAGRTLAYAPGSVNPPTAIVLPAPEDPIVFDATMDEQDEFSLQIRILMSAADERSGQEELLAYVARTGTRSIYAAVAAEPTLGGACSYAVVTRVTAYGDIDWGGQSFFGAELVVQAE